MQADYIPADKNSPFGEGGFRDWIPSKEEEVPVVKPKEQKVLLDPDVITDEDLRDMGIDVAKYRRDQIQDKKDKYEKLAKDIEL